jgi:DNA-binding CsgD family transcriptional regulator/tetratricopeptide (TPR) repeat protein
MALASAHKHLQQRQTALEIYRKAIEVCEKAGMRDDLGRLYTSVGALLDYSSDRTNGLVFLMKGLEIQKEADNPLDAIETHSALGKHYFIDDEFAAAAGHLREAVRLTRELGVVMMEPTNLDMLGLAYMFLERDDEALECFRRALEILNGPGGEKHLNYGYLLHHTGMLYEKLGELDRAQRFMLEAAERAEYQGNDILRSEVYESLFLLAERRGLFDQALVYHKNYAEARFACLDVETTAKLAQMQSDFHVQMLQKEQAIRELETARLRDEMEHRNRELAVATLQLVEKSEHVRKLKEQLREIRVAGCTGIDGALKKIESELGAENDWERFALHFGHVHPGFTERLAKEHPSLTPAEIKICSLLKVNLSNKEISNLLSIDVRTVEIHRGRVRKKLSLTRKDSLASFLTGL